MLKGKKYYIVKHNGKKQEKKEREEAARKLEEADGVDRMAELGLPVGFGGGKKN